MGPLRALIWDVDGTLAETEFNGHREAFNGAFEAAGLGWHWDEATYLRLLSVTGGKERLLAWWQLQDPRAATSPDAAARIAQLHAHKTRLYAERMASGLVDLRPGIARLLDEAAAAGLRQAIATTTTPANVSALLEASLGAGALSRFEVIGAGDVVGAKKPAPDIYRWVLDRLGLAPEQTLALEDSRPGAESALAAGVPVVVLRSRMSREEVWPAALSDALAADPLAPPTPATPAGPGSHRGAAEGLAGAGKPQAEHLAEGPLGQGRRPGQGHWPDPGAKGITLEMLRHWHARSLG